MRVIKKFFRGFGGRGVRNVLTLIIILILVGLSGIGLFLIFGNATTKDKALILLEATKALLQLSMIIIFGGFASLLVSSFEKRRVEDRAVNKYYEEFLSSLQATYQSVMTSRHILRSIGLTDEFGKLPRTMDDDHLKIYKEQMVNINNAQLKLENLVVEVKNFPRAFIEAKKMETAITGMKNYLYLLLHEYESFLPTLNKGKNDLLLKEMVRLLDFTMDKSSEWNSQYLKNHNEAIGLVREELLPMKRSRE